MSDNTQQKPCTVTPIVRLVNLRVNADPPSWAYGHGHTMENRARHLEMWAAEFNDFMRDHRSQDRVKLSVERETKRVCSACDFEWETYEEDGKTLCAGCGREVSMPNTDSNAKAQRRAK